MGGGAGDSETVMPAKKEKGDVCLEAKGEKIGQEEPFTHFSSSQLRKLQLLVGLATTTSSLIATIYLPLLPLLRTHFNTSAQAVNLTLTIYIVFQAISPVIFGPLSDSYDRRPMFLLVLGIYAVSNIGLAVNEHSFAALATLRALQSLGASATYSIAFGVVADVCLPRDRGRMLGPIGMALNLGTCVGPIIGGCVAYFSGSYNWAFWALVIAARRTGRTESKATGAELLDFPIEISRTRGSFVGLVISTATMAGYGWALHQRSHPAVILVLQFLQGFWGTFFYTTYSALLVDSFPQSPSTAAATTSVTSYIIASLERNEMEKGENGYDYKLEGPDVYSRVLIGWAAPAGTGEWLKQNTVLSFDF
ncbi:hypothetical protein DHEL01_v202539 [Diaporthe helianthi]|uniref:Major facilitator superfamily (MFS) profile domain-containing protein n=1 Tax=Diaporthe helianthi TaxID=158607 RepID=A0A2P5I997_DIAHE|nr:hypothetical protein DHEL01_v202539 [Diaporthe helianthi]